MTADRSRPGRRQPNAVRDVRRYVLLTTEEDRRIRARAARGDVTPVRFMVESALGGGGDDYLQARGLFGMLEEIKDQLTRLGNNVNQVARALNTGDARRGELLTLMHRDIPEAQDVIRAVKEALAPR